MQTSTGGEIKAPQQIFPNNSKKSTSSAQSLVHRIPFVNFRKKEPSSGDKAVEEHRNYANCIANKRPTRKTSLLRRLSKRARDGFSRLSARAFTRRRLAPPSAEPCLRAIKNAPTSSQLVAEANDRQVFTFPPQHHKKNKMMLALVSTHNSTHIVDCSRTLSAADAQSSLISLFFANVFCSYRKNRPRAVVVGGGPAGSTAAMYLARAGYEVDVYEGRSEPSSVKISAQRAYMIALTDRGLAALEDLGMDVATRHAQQAGDVGVENSPEQCVSGQLVVHSRLGTLSTSVEERSVCFTRAGLAQMLIDEARAKYPEQIRFHFNVSCC